MTDHCEYLNIRREQNVKPRPNDRNISTQHIATLLGATCCVCLATMLWRVAFQCKTILVPRGRAPFGQHQESRPLARSVLNGFVNTIDWDQNQSDLSDLTLSMHRVTESPWIADFRCWTWPEFKPGVHQRYRQRSRFLVLTKRSATYGDEYVQEFLTVPHTSNFCHNQQRLNTERSYKRQVHAPLRHFVGSPCNGGKPE